MFIAPKVSSSATAAVSHRTSPPNATANSSPNGASAPAAADPSTATVAKATVRYKAPTTTTAAAVARGRSRPGRRNSPARWVIASHPTKLHISNAAAGPMALQPEGANGTRLSTAACGSDSNTASSRKATRIPASTSCTRPASRTPT
ncbi:hypothetical protein Jiend_55720 [Micromonospora endophytica]|nr:hypothetical protein Jiend_55720 [Micromonospora endophytica]